MIIGIVLLTVLSIIIDFYLFFYLIDKKASIKLLLILTLLQLSFNFICNRTYQPILIYFGEEIFYIGLAFLLLRRSSFSNKLKLFYAQIFLTVNNLSLRTITFFIYPLLNVSIDTFKSSNIIPTLSSFIPTILSYLLIRLFKKSFVIIQEQPLNNSIQVIINSANILMLIYLSTQQTLVYLEDSIQLSTLSLRQLLTITYIILFFVMLILLDRVTQDMIKKQLDMQKDIQLQNLKNYNQHIEKLYQTVRSFRHDYENILTTLKIGIDQENLTIVRDIYYSVLEQSNKRIKRQDFDLTRLININDNTLKSLFSAKFLQAEETGIDISLEVPEPISLNGMSMIDFITVSSIFIDNAIEASLEAMSPKVTIAYINFNNVQHFIVTNSTMENIIPISNLFARGVSSKGEDRGIGLANVKEILDKYPNVSLKTSSENYTFTQDLTILAQKA